MAAFWWKAKYLSGEELWQFSPGEPERKYAEIDRSRLSAFEVWSGDRLALTCHIAPGASLIYRLRHTLRVEGEKQTRSTMALVGWRSNGDGKAIAAIFEDGHIEIAPAFKAGHEYLYPPHPHAEEGETAREIELLEEKN